MGIDKIALYYFVDVAKSFPLHNLLMRKKERGQFNEIYLISMSNSWAILCTSLNKYTIKALRHIPSAQLLSAFFQFQLQNYHNQITALKFSQAFWLQCQNNLANDAYGLLTRWGRKEQALFSKDASQGMFQLCSCHTKTGQLSKNW